MNYCGDVCAKCAASDTDALQFPRGTHRDDQAVDSTAEASRQLIAAASQNGEHMTPASSRAPVAENAMAWGSSGVIGCRRDQPTAP
jgi:hypothetical protein